MRQSEYNVVDQLKKTPAKISILTLVLNSPAHRQALQRVLNEAYVQPDATPEKVVNLVNAARVASRISFTDEEIPIGSTSRPKALHISVKCHGCTMARVLIDGGSSLNILPMTTLGQLPVNISSLAESNMIVRGFDGTKREVIGSITLPIKVGIATFEAELQVMSVEPTYTMLLGRPWIHSAGAVPSTLHQSVKFAYLGGVVTVKGEEEMLITKPSTVPYIDAAEESWESSFQGLEVDNSSKDVNSVIAKIMKKSSFEADKGL